MKQELSVWSLIANNEFEKACERADEQYRNSGDITDLRNKVYALLHLKKVNDAISLSEKIIEFRKGETSSDLLFLGIEHWILGDIDKAINVWQQAQRSTYQDAAGGIDNQVFLYFAAVKTGKDKLKLSVIKVIKKLLKSKRANNFPGPLGRYLIDDINDNELLSSVDHVPILKERELCQARFVSAIKTLEAGSTVEYYKKLRECVSYGPSCYLEQMYYLANGELDASEGSI